MHVACEQAAEDAWRGGHDERPRVLDAFLNDPARFLVFGESDLAAGVHAGQLFELRFVLGEFLASLLGYLGRGEPLQAVQDLRP